MELKHIIKECFLLYIQLIWLYQLIMIDILLRDAVFHADNYVSLKVEKNNRFKMNS